MRTSTLAPPIAVTIVFCTVLGCVGVVQSVRELRQGTEQSALQVFSRPPQAVHLRSFERKLENKSWLTAVLRPRTQSIEFRWLDNAGEKVVVGRDGWYFYRPGLSYLTARRRPAVDSSSQDAVTAICDFRDQLASRGIRLIVMPVPNKESVYPERLTLRGTRLGATKPLETKSLFAALRGADVEFLDLFSLFSEARSANLEDRRSPLYLAQDSHWSPRGLRLAAKAMAVQVRRLGVGLKVDTPMDEKQIEVTRHGDLLQMLQTPFIEEQVAAERIECSQVARCDTGLPHAGDTDSEILILGDSFLRIFESDEPGSAGFISHLARELSQPLTSLVSDGGASTLARQELFRRGRLLAGKKVVIWEFVERDIRFGLEGWQTIPLPPLSDSR